MCMGNVYDYKHQQQVIRKMACKNGYIRVYKVVNRWSGERRYRGDCTGYPHKAGICTAQDVEEQSGFHAFRDIYSAKQWVFGTFDIIIECLARPAWVKNCGIDGPKRTILLRRLCFPKYPSRKVTVREFRKALKNLKGTNNV